MFPSQRSVAVAAAALVAALAGGDDFLDGRAGRDTLHGGTGLDTCLAGERLRACEVTS